MSKQAYIQFVKKNPLTKENVFSYESGLDFMKEMGAKPGAFRTKDLRRFVGKFKHAKMQYEKEMEGFRQKQRKTQVSRSAVQRRAFFESPEPAMSGAMKTTTGAS